MNVPTLLSDRPFFARYKSRVPDPGVCRITMIDWEQRRLSMSNGACSYYPSFDEVEIVQGLREIKDSFIREAQEKFLKNA